MSILRRRFQLGAHELVADDAPTLAAPYILAGPQLYAIGQGDGAVGPIGAEHLVGEMGGIWAHPVKVADGFALALHGADDGALPLAEGEFSAGLDEIGWRWRSGDLRLSRRDRVLPGAPAYAMLLEVSNEGKAALTAALEVRAELKFLGCWFGGMAGQGGAYSLSDALILGHDEARPGWGIALGAPVPPDAFTITPRERGATVTLRYAFSVAPGAVRSWPLLLAVSQRGGHAAAQSRWRELIDGVAAAFADGSLDETKPLPDPLAGLPALRAADGELERDFALAQANLRTLEADYPDTGPYFLAGLPEYPQLFGCDTTYSVPGAVAAGFGATTRAALGALAGYAERACGRVPHEVTTNGRVFHPGNIQETPQLAIAVWDQLRWSGDLEFARRLLPLLREGVTAYVPAMGGPDPRYPVGDGMVERFGMGSRKLDVVCYQVAGLQALARLAAALGEPDAAAYAERAAALRRDFERDWWLEEEGLYADSMHSDGSLQLDRHWTAVLPVQLGLAAPERAARVMARIEAEFVNEWGLVHTVGVDERVWTLPSGLLALVAFQQGRAERGLALLRNIALTARQGALGCFKELIPEGLCFVQLWSAGLYLQGVIEGLLGLQPDAAGHSLTVAPCLPEGHGPITLRELRVGAHRVSVTIAPGTLELTHSEGPAPLSVRYAGASAEVAPGTVFRGEERG
jgi:hypothetical protein